jgi:hypothetical protein
LALAWTRRRCGPSWTCCGDDPPASQRTGVSVPDAVRHAQELRQSTGSGSRAPGVGRLRRTPVCIYEPTQATRDFPDPSLSKSTHSRNLGRFPAAVYETLTTISPNCCGTPRN